MDNTMTIKDAILKALEEIKESSTHRAIELYCKEKNIPIEDSE